MPKTNDEKKVLHLIVGTPDDDCPVCQAHGVGKKAGSGRDDGGPSDRGCSSGAFVEDLTFIDILRCPCPMCAAARKEGLID